MQYLDDLMSIPADSTLWDVYALTAPLAQGGTEKKIGSLKLDGIFTTSKWADENLYFRH